MRVAVGVVIVWLCACSAAYAQGSGRVRGTVVDSLGGAPIERVSVRVQGTPLVTTTDAEGGFDLIGVPAGDHELYVSVVDFLLVTRRFHLEAGESVELTVALTQGTGTYAETVSVVGDAGARNAESPSDSQVRGIELQQLSGLLANDPMRAVQAMPGVATGDDFRSEFAVRGAGPRQTGFIFDGISTSFMLHTVQQVNDAGSIAMVNGDILDSVALRSGSYPGRYGDRTGAEVEFQLREGSRDRMRAHVAVSAVDASAVAEGPLGRRHTASWLVSARKSYLDLILKRIYSDRPLSFGFTDAQAKLAWRPSARHQLTVSLTGGQSLLDLVPNAVSNPNDLRQALNESGVGVLAWRFVPVPAFSLTQRVAVVANDFRNTSRDGPVLDDGTTRDLVYRAEWVRPLGVHLALEGGGEGRWTRATGNEQRLSGGKFVVRERFAEASTRAGTYVSARVSRGALVFTPGLRVDHWSLTGTTALSPWSQVTVPLSGSLQLRAGAGVYREAPDTAQVAGVRGSALLAVARATHVDVGVEGQLGAGLRWHVTAYNREDRNLPRLPGTEVRLVNGVFTATSTLLPWQSALDGHARGVEWMLERHAERGVSGWISYALGFARYTDHVTGEHFWGDYDQRHTFNAFGTYRLSDRTSMSARLRLGSSMPAPGYWAEHGGQYFVSDTRNNVRVPSYARFDVRANRTFTRTHGRLTLYVEVVNATARDNQRFQPPSVNRKTLEATGLFESLLPLVPSAGLLVEF